MKLLAPKRKYDLLNFFTRYLLLLSLIAISNFAISQQVISSSGAHAVSTNAQIAWTIGESVIQTVDNGETTLTQGMQQSFIEITAIDEFKNQGIEISTFPNPTYDFITIQTTGSKEHSLKYFLYDITGKVIQESTIENDNTKLEMSKYRSGNYVLQIFISELNADAVNSLTQIKAFKIIKK
jgi:hypothetical protein